MSVYPIRIFLAVSRVNPGCCQYFVLRQRDREARSWGERDKAPDSRASQVPINKCRGRLCIVCIFNVDDLNILKWPYIGQMNWN